MRSRARVQVICECLWQALELERREVAWLVAVEMVRRAPPFPPAGAA